MKPIDLPALITSRQPKDESLCQWFLLCENPHTMLVPHPILGDVPTCGSCADKVERLSPREVIKEWWNEEEVTQ